MFSDSMLAKNPSMSKQDLVKHVDGRWIHA